MLTSVIGKKVGMTLIFDDKQNAVPVTVVDVNHCYVTQLKTVEKEGYVAVQVGLVRKRHQNTTFSDKWLTAKKDYFSTVKELSVDPKQSKDGLDLQQGQKVTLDNCVLQKGEKVSVCGMSKGKGFQGVVKRWGFSGGPSGHGSNFHRRPGASSGLRTQGEVIKGKKFPGHKGVEKITVKGLEIIEFDKDSGYLFIKGAVPGKTNSLVVIRKQG